MQPVACALVATSLPLTIIKEMEEMSLRLDFSQTVAKKLVDNRGIVLPQTLASLSDEDIATIWDMINRPGGLVSGKTLDRKNQISFLDAKNLKLPLFMLYDSSNVLGPSWNGLVLEYSKGMTK